MHIIPDLKKLEAKYPEELVVIGVHSAKFLNEKQTESIRQAILRYEIRHPVINDKDFEVWHQYGVHAWPTLVLINPQGRVIGNHSGEGIFDLFDETIGRAVQYFERKGELKRSALRLALGEAKKPNTLLAFPGKISADAKTGSLFISDSNHNRILITDSEGAIQDSIGSGDMGSKDGTFEEAEFNHPQGTFLDGELLYIADTENHLIRAANLKTKRVDTLLGTGRQGMDFNRPGTGREVAISSPWDLLAEGGKLYIAMAGFHQLWIMDLETLAAKPFAGSGQEARIDGPLSRAALAQPSGITTDGKKLYFADSETSSIRSADLDPKGNVETLIGEDLFEFGDVDGARPAARLQHALGVFFKDGRLYVADTYNSKIKIVDPAKKIAATYAGTGRHGMSDGERLKAEFYEPGGLAALGDTLYITDTNNHVIRTLDLKTAQVRTMGFSRLEKLAALRKKNFRGRIVELPKQEMKEGRGKIVLGFNLPQGYHLNEKAPFWIEWRSSDEKVLGFTARPDQLDLSQMTLPLEIPVSAVRGTSELTFDTTVYFCRDPSSPCLFENLQIKAPVEITSQASSELKFSVDVK